MRDEVLFSFIERAQQNPFCMLMIKLNMQKEIPSLTRLNAGEFNLISHNRTYNLVYGGAAVRRG